MSKELIERLREAAAQRVASTAMIGAEDLSAAADALESLEAAYASAVEAGKALAKQALKAEQERDAIAAELKALREQEPVSHEFQAQDGSWRGFINESHYKNTVEDGSWPIRALYAHPVPARELTDAIIGKIYIKKARHIEHATQREIAFARAIEAALMGEGE